MPDRRKLLHYEVAENFDLPETKPGQYIVAIHNLHMANRAGRRARQQDFKTFKTEGNRSVGYLADKYTEVTGTKCIFSDGRDFLANETQLRAVNYFRDDLITLEAYENNDPKEQRICPTLQNGVAAFPFNVDEQDEILFASHQYHSHSALISLVHGLCRCHYRKTTYQLPRLSFQRLQAQHISWKAIEKHLKDNDHGAFIEARQIRESAVPGAVKHKRMLVFPAWFQDVLDDVYNTYPDDLLLPKFDTEWECDSDCDHGAKHPGMFEPTGLNMVCLECPKNRYGEWKDFPLQETEESENPINADWIDVLKHLRSRPHRTRVAIRLARSQMS